MASLVQLNIEARVLTGAMNSKVYTSGRTYFRVAPYYYAYPVLACLQLSSIVLLSCSIRIQSNDKVHNTRLQPFHHCM